MKRTKEFNATPNYLPVFVYGTLRAGLGNYNWALKGRTKEEVPAFVFNHAIFPVSKTGGFPCMIKNQGTIVQGELMYIKPELFETVMQDLDGLEGYIETDLDYSMYHRKLITVSHGVTGEPIKAWTYYWNLRTEKEIYDFIPNGDYVRFEEGFYDIIEDTKYAYLMPDEIDVVDIDGTLYQVSDEYWANEGDYVVIASLEGDEEKKKHFELGDICYVREELDNKVLVTNGNYTCYFDYESVHVLEPIKEIEVS